MSGSYSPPIKAIRAAIGGRLSLVSGDALATGNNSGTTLYLTPYSQSNCAAQISLYSGTSWDLYDLSEISLSLSGFTANSNYDIFCGLSGSTPSLFSQIWTNDTTRASFTVINGINHKSATNYRHIGSIRTTTTGNSADTGSQRFVWNCFNRVEKPLIKYVTGTWTYLGGVRYWNGDSANKVEVLAGFDEAPAKASLLINSINTNGGTCFFGFGIDSSSAFAGLASVSGLIQAVMPASIPVSQMMGMGYHYLSLLETTQTATSTNGQYSGTANTGLEGNWWC
jgi:hypothetical protein